MRGHLLGRSAVGTLASATEHGDGFLIVARELNIGTLLVQVVG